MDLVIDCKQFLILERYCDMCLQIRSIWIIIMFLFNSNKFCIQPFIKNKELLLLYLRAILMTQITSKLKVIKMYR